MDDIASRHSKQRRDLQSVITQKKKSATKKNRKAINDECARLERELQDRQSAELAPVNGEVDCESDDESKGSNLLVMEERTSQQLLVPDEVKADSRVIDIPSIPKQKQEVKKPNRQKARLARRAAEQAEAVERAEKEASELPDLREKEQQSMREAYVARDLVEQEIRSDGHCLYAAVADQLAHVGIDSKPSGQLGDSDANKEGFRQTRQVAAAYIERNADDFVPFMESPLEEYLSRIRQTGEWGGHLEILALSKAYDININVLHGDGHVDSIESGSHKPQATVWLSFYHHSHGLGEHYNSLRRKL